MKYSKDLYELIKTLSQTEKQYIKLLANVFSSQGTAKELALFDTVDQQKDSEEKQLREAFSEQISLKNFHAAKSCLYQLILKALYQYRQQLLEKRLKETRYFR